MKKVVKNKPLTDKTFKAAVIICLEHDPVNGLFNVEPYGMMPDWDVSQVTDMFLGFYGAESFNGNISKWNTSNVTDMTSMFDGASSFNQNIGDWDVSKVTNMDWMFDSASSFNQNIGSWDVSKVTSMYSMFDRTPAWTLPKPNFKTPK